MKKSLFTQQWNIPVFFEHSRISRKKEVLKLYLKYSKKTIKIILRYLICKDVDHRSLPQKIRDIKPAHLFVHDILRCWIKWKEFPFVYFFYNLWLKSFNPTNDVTDFIPVLSHEKYRDMHITCKAKYMISSKISMSKFLHSMNIPHPRTFLHSELGRIYAEDNSIIEEEQFKSVLSTIKTNKIFVKPDIGYGGQDVMAFRKGEDNQFIDEKQGLIFDFDFIKKMSERMNFLCQEGLKQVDELNILNPDSINSLRIMTKFKDNQVKTFVTLIRMGRAGSHVDNTTSGGLSCEIDTETWILKREAVFPFSNPLKTTICHPDTKVPFEGLKLPFREETLYLVEKNALLFPGCETIGWDIALTPEGPVIIEINWNPCPQLAQVTLRRGLAKEFFN